jgi:hypothetical protein
VISVLPNFGSHAWITSPDNPPFIAKNVYRACLRRDENILVFPAGARGDSMLWQAESGFWFRMAGGYLSPVVPATFRRFRAAHATDAPTSTPRQILALAHAKGVRAIIVDSHHSSPWRTLPGRPIDVAGVLVYPVSGASAAATRCVG